MPGTKKPQQLSLPPAVEHAYGLAAAELVLFVVDARKAVAIHRDLMIPRAASTVGGLYKLW